jgi:hypothetical protein
MAKKGGAAGGGEGSKKAQGQARKADAAASKQAVKDKQAEAAESEKWDKGAKSNAKAYVLLLASQAQKTDQSTVRLPPKRPPKPRAKRPRKKHSYAKRKPHCLRNPRAKHLKPKRNPAVSTLPLVRLKQSLAP